MDVPEILQQLLDDGVIDDVRARLMSGKEAAVFIVERRGELVAAKVYKDREQRTFKATASYTEGRNQTRNTRDKRAMGKRTSYGKELVEASWRDMEYQALQQAFLNGVRVPEPLLLYENVLLMELLVDETGAPAPRLADFELSPEVATLLHREVYGQVRLLLRCGKIHGDLSAFNILVARDGPTLIDLPQVVDASMNNSAPTILQRDLQNVTEHLARFDSRLLRFRDCGSVLWQHYQRGEIDRATEPEEGGVRRQDARGHKGRRAREAERGRTGRGTSERAPGERPRAQQAQPKQQQQQQQQQQQHQHQQRQPQHAREKQRAPDQRAPDQRAPDQRTPDQRAPEQRAPERGREQRPRDSARPNEQRAKEQARQEQQRSQQQRPEQQRPEQQRPEQQRPQQQRPQQQPSQQQRPQQRREQHQPQIERREPQIQRREPPRQEQRREQPRPHQEQRREQPRPPQPRPEPNQQRPAEETKRRPSSIRKTPSW